MLPRTTLFLDLVVRPSNFLDDRRVKDAIGLIMDVVHVSVN